MSSERVSLGGHSPVNDKLYIANGTIHVIVGLHVLIIVLSVLLGGLKGEPAMFLSAGFFFLVAIFCEIVVLGLKAHRPWAWYAAAAIFLMHLVPFGPFGFWGLLDKESRKQCGVA